MLYQLSYASDPTCSTAMLRLVLLLAFFTDLRRAGDGARTRDIKLGRLALYQLSYSRDIPPRSTASAADGGGRIRTFEGLRRQIYSLIPLATWVPHPITSRRRCASVDQRQS